MNRIQRLWRDWRNRRMDIDWTDEQEHAWGALRWLMGRADGLVDDRLRADFDQFARDVEHDRRLVRERRRR